jgi:hypothetical protein
MNQHKLLEFKIAFIPSKVDVSNHSHIGFGVNL